MKTNQSAIAFAVFIGLATLGSHRAFAQTEDEPNNDSTTADAATLPLNNIKISVSGKLRTNNQTPNPRDQDWFKIKSSATFTSIIITITPSGIDGNERISYQVKDANMNNLFADTVSSSSKEMEITSPGSGDFFIRVFDAGSLTSASGEGKYQIDAVGVDPNSPPTETTEVELNDDSSSADVLSVPFTPGSTSGATVSGRLREGNQTRTPRDQDWFTFTNAHKFSSMKVKLIPEGIDSNQHISWQILDDELTVLFDGDTNNVSEQELSPTAHGAIFFVRVFDDGNLDSNSAQANYSVQVTGVGGVDPATLPPVDPATIPTAGKAGFTISDVQNQSVVSGSSTAAIPFKIAPATATVTATSSDQVLVPNANISLGGAGVDRTVTIKATANESGPVTITLTVSNGKTTITDTFVLTVTPGKPQNFAVSFTQKGKALIDGRAKRQFGSVKSTNKIGNMRTITITNTGTKPLKKLKIVRDGANAKDFIVKGYSSKPLKQGASITVYIYFKPKSSGQSFADLHIFSSETPDNPFDLALVGKGVGQAL